jgi:hypothetical protein
MSCRPPAPVLNEMEEQACASSDWISTAPSPRRSAWDDDYDSVATRVVAVARPRDAIEEFFYARCYRSNLGHLAIPSRRGRIVEGCRKQGSRSNAF